LGVFFYARKTIRVKVYMKWRTIRTGAVGLSALVLCLAIQLFPLGDCHFPKAEGSGNIEFWYRETSIAGPIKDN